MSYEGPSCGLKIKQHLDAARFGKEEEEKEKGVCRQTHKHAELTDTDTFTHNASTELAHRVR